MTRIRALVPLSLLTFAAALVLGGCDLFGGGADAQEVIDETFSNEQTVTSGVLDITIEGEVTGATGGSFSASLGGPFQGVEGDPSAIPQLDWTVSANASGLGQTFDFEGGLIVTEDNAYVEYQGQAYEVGTQTFDQLKQAFAAAAQAQPEGEDLSAGEQFTQGCEQAVEQAGGDTSACEIDFNSWLENLSDEGTEDIEGVSTTHIHGDVNVDQMIDDVLGLVQATSGGAAGLAVPSEEQIQQVSDAISEASFDLYSGEDDRILRGLDFALGIDPSAIEGAETAGVESVSLTFSLRLGAVNQPQSIDAPAEAQPLDRLLSELGLGDLGGLGALGGGLPFGATGPSGGLP